MKYELTLEGMSCAHCVSAVKEALARVDDVMVEHVAIGQAIIETADILAVHEKLVAELAGEGYPMQSSTLI